MLSKNKKGFTLIEIMIAIAIVGILAAAVLVSIKSYKKKARSNKMLAEMSSAIASTASCWASGGKVDSPKFIKTEDLLPGESVYSGTSVGMGGNNICYFGDDPETGGNDSYGLWPKINVKGTDLASYYYWKFSGLSYPYVDPLNPIIEADGTWYIGIYSIPQEDDVGICCSSRLKSCKIGEHNMYLVCDGNYQ